MLLNGTQLEVSELPGVFTEELKDAEGQMLSQAELCPKYHHGTRYVQLRRFPYLVVFRLQNENFQIIAVAHTKRRPFYWTRRLNT